MTESLTGEKYCQHQHLAAFSKYIFVLNIKKLNCSFSPVIPYGPIISIHKILPFKTYVGDFFFFEDFQKTLRILFFYSERKERYPPMRVRLV